jgi:hypothetical protein
VRADGNISMPLIRYVRVAGLSSSEAEVSIPIETQLRKNNVVNDSGIQEQPNLCGFYSALGPSSVVCAAGGPRDH